MRIAEICCGSVEDAVKAARNHVDRIELNSSLYLGGLTPSLASVQIVKSKTHIPMICMNRVRPGGFCYSEEEIHTMYKDGEIMLENGADGIAFGMLTKENEIDENAVWKMVDLIHSFGKIAVFHRAFDCVADPEKAIEKLIDLKVDRILTSGLHQNAIDGLSVLKMLQSTYGDKIELTVASGVNSENVRRIFKETGIEQAHTSAKRWYKDTTTSTRTVDFSYCEAGDFDGCDEKKIKDFVEAVHSDEGNYL